MPTASRLAPLLISLELTPEQRDLIREKTGLTLAVLPIQSDVPVVRCRFGGITLRVTRGVFSPSVATENMLALVRQAAAGHRQPIIVDVGTGCGAVALATATALPHASIVATELSELAVRCARRNRDRLRLRNVTIRRGSLLAPVPRRLHHRVAVIAGNVPYVPPAHSNTFESLFPAGTAIGVGDDGLGLVRELARTAYDVLMPGGSLVLQAASFQWPALSAELTALGYDFDEDLNPVANRPFAVVATTRDRVAPTA